MKNPFVELHGEFKAAGADILISSGQACVLYGIAAFSKDGDWIVREDEKSFKAVLQVLSRKGAEYRLGAPLDLQWHRLGWTSHFEYISPEGYRIRIDFCSRPPRIRNLDDLWNNAVRKRDIDIIDVEHLILVKQTRRAKDYPIIGSLAEIAGFECKRPSLVLNYLQDYGLLKKAVDRWPGAAEKCSRKAVRLLRENASRNAVVSALAREQDKIMREDDLRVSKMRQAVMEMGLRFNRAKAFWRRKKLGLLKQHKKMISISEHLLKTRVC